MSTKTVIALLAGFGLGAYLSGAQVPGVINHQGRLTVNGTNFTGLCQFKFALVNGAGDRTFWSHDTSSVAGSEPTGSPIALEVTRGVFSVNLGDLAISNMVQAIPAPIFTNSAVYLRVWVDDGANGFQRLNPDRRIAAAAYALTAGHLLGRLNEEQLPANVASLNKDQSFAGTNTFAGVTQLPNLANQVAGTFTGDGSGLTNLRGSSVTGPVARAIDFSGVLTGDITGTQGATFVSTIGGASAAAVVAGAAFAIAANSGNVPYSIVRRDANGGFSAGTVSGTFVGDGNGLTNLNAAQLAGALSAAIVESALPPGIMLVSMSAQDSGLLAKGYRLAMTVPAPAWVNGATVNAPSARSGHTAIWDGQEFIVWGGTIGVGTTVNSGGLWRPESDAWAAVSSVNAPTARSGHSAVWSGTEMLVWGGKGAGGYVRTGGKFQPGTQLWTTMAVNNAPSERSGHIAIWTGSRMLIWGGQNDSGLLNDGALYDPTSNQWTLLTAPNAPEARIDATAVWTGNRLIIWGGQGANGALQSGAQLLFSSNGSPLNWTAINTATAPLPRRWHTAIWTGARMMVWGGERGGVPLGDGAAYDPTADAWEPLSGINVPAARFHHVALWTGQEMLIAGGSNGSTEFATGSAYDPLTQLWRPLSTSGNPQPRAEGAAAWTGTELLVFGGLANGQPVGALQRLVPQPVWYFYRKL